ncbi:cell surface protein SprA [Flavobacteriales bacterium]|nr:cell surface protein SprA [Flavobacteriales bacterium]
MLKLINRLSIVMVAIAGLGHAAVSDASIVGESSDGWGKDLFEFKLDTPPPTDTLPYPLQDTYDPTPTGNENGLYLSDPENVQTDIEYNPETDEYDIQQNIGEDIQYRPPTYMSFDEFQEYNAEQAVRDYWREKAATQSESQRKPLIPKLNIKSKLFETIFCGNTVEIRPQGSAELIFGVNVSKIDNPALPENQKTNTTFNFDQSIQLNVTGKIGDAMTLGVNYNTDATFDFENEMKLKWEACDDDNILRSIEAGNVSLPLTGSLISGSQNLFGVKTKLQFGRLTVTGIFSQQKSESNNVSLGGGGQGQITEFEVKSDEYESNRHFFLSQFFREGYDEWLKDLPLVKSPINITRIEVWVTNTSAQTDGGQRNIVSFMDLGEPAGSAYNQTFIGPGSGNQSLPNNSANNLYEKITSQYIGARDVDNVESVFGPLVATDNFVNSQDYEGLEFATSLSPSEYYLHPQLGYISLTREMQPNEVLSVAFQYTYGGQVYQVGEFSTDGISGENALYTKLLKSTVTNPKVPMWDLMMKNVYNIGGYGLQQGDITLNVIYDNIEAGTRTNYLTEGAIDGQILLRTMNLDQLNNNNDPFPDGFFDHVEGVTVRGQQGRIYFPVIEPFGSHLKSKFAVGEEEIADKYVYQQLYDSTKQAALNFPELNRFIIGGQYSGEGGNVFSLGGMNIPEGSVTVTAGSETLQEGSDYIVDYVIGRVTITGPGIIESGRQINASYESNSLFNIQQKTLGGVHLDYVISDDLAFGATVLNLSERPLTQKVNMGDEPINNTIWGVNGNYRTESRLLTKLVDYIPLINTKEISTVSVSGEFAHLIPGNARAITKGGIAYIDDFEGSVNFIDLKSRQSWVLASTPQGQTESDMFPEGLLSNDIGNGMNRASLAWYIIDPLFYRNNTLTPDHLSAQDRSINYSREVLEQEIFPNKQSQIANQQTNLPTFDVAYYPAEKGPYNYDADGVTPDGQTVAAGLEVNGSLKEPESRWGGIMRPINTADFEANNIEFIQFWMMDPFHDDVNNTHSGGDLYFNIGNVSEDILRDGQKAFENGLPTPSNNNPTDTTNQAIVSGVQNIINVFDNDPESRPYQDIGLDGMNDSQEVLAHTSSADNNSNSDYVDRLNAMLGPGLSQAAYDRLIADVSSDNFLYYRRDEWDAQQASVLERYKQFNGLENNSPTADQSGTSFQASSTTIPDVEDINRDFTMNKSENYFQYRVSMRKEDLVVGKNYITNEVEGRGTLDNGDPINIKWYQFKIPVRDPDRIVGNIQDFRSIRFLRMFYKGFEDSIVTRFARLELVRGEWRRYLFSLEEPGEYIPGDPSDETPFDISVVNIEENGEKDPINYILPPGIDRQQTPSSNTTLRQLNEQALLLKVCDLADGDARAAFKNTEFDIRSYKKLKMFVHAEAVDQNVLNDDDVTVFLRLGTDFDNNYYEYEVPLIVTPEGDYSQDISSDRYDVWPILNNIDLEFSQLTNVKQQRNRDLISNPEVSITKRYEIEHGPRNKITIKGNPNLANIKSMIIGIRNPKKENAHDGDDGLAKCVEIWVNELRLTDFDNKGGWATTSQVNLKLADFATLNGAADYTKFGFGSFDSKPSDRLRESVANYDLSAQIRLGMFFPKKWGINVPMYLSYGETFGTPEYNPLDPDITMAASLSNLETEGARDTLRRNAERYSKRRSMNFTDIKIGVKSKKSMPWDPANFGFNYSYNQDYMRDINTKYKETRTYRGGMTYDYNPKAKNVRPFAKLKLVNAMVDATKESKQNKHVNQKAVVDSLKRAKVKGEEMKEAEEKLEKYAKRKERYKKWSRKMLRSGWWRPIKDFNFNYLPKRLGFSTDADRRYTEQQLRNTTQYSDIKIDSTFQKSFLWNRSYHFKYDLTKAIKIQFDAFNFGRVDEPEGPVDRKFDNWEHMRDSIWTNVLRGGRTTQYNHTTTVNWTLPINKFPILSWVTANASYTGNYTWNAAPLERQTDGTFDQSSFGNTVQNSQNWQINGNANFTQLYNKVPFLKKINQNRRRSANARKAAAKGRSSKSKKGGKELSKDSIPEKDKPNVGKIIGEGIASFIMMLKSVNVTYSENNGTMLPGYQPKSKYIGLDDGMRNMGGFVPFIFGWQNNVFDDVSTGYDIREEAIRGNWITADTLQSNPLVQSQSSSLNIRATLEPIKGFRIDLTATRTYTESVSEFFRWDEAIQSPVSFNPVTTGNFSMSYITVNTTFIRPRDDNSSPVFDSFKESRLNIAQRLASEYPGVLLPHEDNVAYPEGYGPTQQEVLIPAFLSSYGVFSPEQISTSPFPRIPLPNWRVNYDGLGKIPFMKKVVRNLTLGHAYRSTYSVSNFTTNLGFEGVALADGTISDFPNTKDSSNNFIPRLQIGTITISEQFSPLVSLDFTFKNSLTAKLEVKTSRTLSLNFSNNQLTEVTSEEYIVGAGYTFKAVPFPIRFGKSKKRIKSDLNFRIDFAMRDNRTMIRKIDEDVNQATSGQKLISIKVNADYVINQRFNIRLFYDAAINKPVVSSSFPTENHAAGLSLRFTLSD